MSSMYLSRISFSLRSYHPRFTHKLEPAKIFFLREKSVIVFRATLWCFNMNELTCFKAYDIRGRVPEELDEELAYKIGLAYFCRFSLVASKDKFFSLISFSIK